MATIHGLTTGVIPAINDKVKEFSAANRFNKVSIVCLGSIYSCEAGEISRSCFLAHVQSIVDFEIFSDENTFMQEIAQKVVDVVTEIKISPIKGQSALVTIGLEMSGYNKKTGNRERLVEQSNDFSYVFNFSKGKPARIFQPS